ncbi:MAG: penicillin acylase family protein [Myxococcota bacterium]
MNRTPGFSTWRRVTAGRALRRLGWLVLPALLGCSSWRAFGPPVLDPTSTLSWRPKRTQGPTAAVEVLLDGDGVPHLYGEGEEDLAYGLGFLHARDRLMQIVVAQHAATGRLGELFGRGFVEEDRRLRLLTHRLDDEEAALPERARALLESYVAGLNEGASHAGRGLEMQLLGLNTPTFLVRDVLAIARLHAFQSALDFRAELARSRLAARLPPGDPRRRALLRDVPAQGAAIIDERRKTRGLSLPSLPQAGAHPSSFVEEEPVSHATAWATSSATIGSLLDDRASPGGSSAWALHGTRTTTGHPVLVADPHLAHRAPGAMYLVHLEGAGIAVTGATLPGLPAVVMGATPEMAWALTASFADTQDLVELTLSTERRNHYLVDGETLPLRSSVERFYAGGTLLLSETFFVSGFGPVLPPGFATDTEPGKAYALMWSGFDPEATCTQLLGFWDLARAQNLDDADRALAQLATSHSVLLATQDGHIAYRLTGKLPKRSPGESRGLPRDGSSRRAAWEGYVPFAELAAVTDPDEGFLVAANQRILDEPNDDSARLGGYASTPHRALRIRELLESLVGRGPADPQALVDMQRDIRSVEATRLQPLFANACPRTLRGFDTDDVAAFCEAVRDFDGAYGENSRGALPFTLLLHALQLHVLEVHLGEDIARQLAAEPFVTMAIEAALLEEASGSLSPLFDDLRTQPREGLGRFVAAAVGIAMEQLHDELGRDPEAWRWGNLHALSFRGPLSHKALIGGLFATPPRPESGCARCVRAEGGLPVENGAVLRLLALMGPEPSLGLITDFGNSGHVGDPHYGDLTARWSRGELLSLPVPRRVLRAAPEGRVILLPRPHAQGENP